MKKTTYPLAEALALDHDRKRILDKEFGDFYKLMKGKFCEHPEFKELDARLEKVKESVKALAWGKRFVRAVVEVEEPEGWDD